MPVSYIAADSIGAGNRITGAAGTDYVILRDRTVGSTDNHGFFSSVGHRIAVEGALIGYGAGIVVGADDTDTFVSVGNDGVVLGDVVSGIISQGNLTVSNYGRIAALDGDGITATGNDRFYLTNYGSVEGGGTGLGDAITLGTAEAGAVVVNYGVISAGDRVADAFSYAYLGASIGQDQVWNYGTMIGQIDLGGGNDFYDGSEGEIVNVGTGGRGRLIAGAGQDLVIGGAGGEEFFGQAGADILQGRGGADILDGGLDNDELYGGDHNDRLLGGSGNDYIDGQGENDTIYGGDNNDNIFGNIGDDYIDGQGENDVIDGGAGNDTILGNIGQDQMSGGTGFDRLVGGLGDDQFRFYFADLEHGGRDVILDFAEAGGNADLLVFYDGITAANVTTFAQGADTLVRITANGGTLVHEILVENFTPAQLADQIFFL